MARAGLTLSWPKRAGHALQARAPYAILRFQRDDEPRPEALGRADTTRRGRSGKRVPRRPVWTMLSIRRAERRDVSEILALIRELAEYEKLSHEVRAEEADLLRDGFSGSPRFFVEMAEWAGEVAGFALWFFNYSTFQGQRGLYLEDLFVRPSFRERGIGKALLVHLARVAEREGCGRFQWQVLEWNEPAVAFYEALGARALHDWITMRISDGDIARLAGG